MSDMRKRAIEKALDGVYTLGQNESLAWTIDQEWETLHRQHRAEYLTNHICMWYGGGDTAAHAAREVIKAVEEES